MPSFKCRNFGKQCRFEVNADSEEQVMEEALEHVKKVHNLETTHTETIDKIKKAIKK